MIKKSSSISQPKNRAKIGLFFVIFHQYVMTVSTTTSKKNKPEIPDWMVNYNPDIHFKHKKFQLFKNEDSRDLKQAELILKQAETSKKFCKVPNTDKEALILGGCLECKRGSYLVKKSETLSICMPCAFDCEECESLFSCSACKIGFFLRPNKQCYLCSIGCKRCSSREVCSECLEGYFMKDEGSRSVSCRQCPIHCNSCSNDFFCDNCVKGFGRSSERGGCSECLNDCESCQDHYLRCTRCRPGFEVSDSRTRKVNGVEYPTCVPPFYTIKITLLIFGALGLAVFGAWAFENFGRRRDS